MTQTLLADCSPLEAQLYLAYRMQDQWQRLSDVADLVDGGEPRQTLLSTTKNKRRPPTLLERWLDILLTTETDWAPTILGSRPVDECVFGKRESNATRRAPRPDHGDILATVAAPPKKRTKKAKRPPSAVESVCARVPVCMCGKCEHALVTIDEE